MKQTGPASSEGACREELLAWLDAHTQWPLSARIETSAQEVVAVMHGRLIGGFHPAVYEIFADEGSLQFAVPAVVVDVEIDGARSARFARADLPIAIVLLVPADRAP